MRNVTCGIFALALLSVAGASPVVDAFKAAVDWTTRTTESSGNATALGQNIPLTGTPTPYVPITKAANSLNGSAPLSSISPDFPLSATVFFTGTELSGDRIQWDITCPGAVGQVVQIPDPNNPGQTIPMTITAVTGRQTALLTQLPNPVLDPFSFKPRTVSFVKSALPDRNDLEIRGRLYNSILFPVVARLTTIVYDGFGGGAGLGVVRGTATLEDWSASYAGRPFSVVVNGQTLNTTLDATGGFVVFTNFVGTHSVTTRTPLSLTKVTSNVDLSASTALTLLHRNGDCNGDNVVDLSDYTAVALAFNALPTSPNWDVTADLNGDQVVDLTDYTRITINFNALGE